MKQYPGGKAESFTSNTLALNARDTSRTMRVAAPRARIEFGDGAGWEAGDLVVSVGQAFQWSVMRAL